MSTSGGEIRSGIGARLKAGRERMGMTLLQVAEKLHVDPKVLEAVEEERFSEFAAPVYVKGHLKRYSELVGENTQQMLDEYSASTKPVLPDLTQLPKASRHADPRKLVLPSLVVLIAFALVGTVWWILQNFDRTQRASQPISTLPEAQQSTPAPGDVASTSPPTTVAPAETPAAPAGAPSSAASAQNEATPSNRARTDAASRSGSSSPQTARPRTGGGAPATAAAAAEAARNAATPATPPPEPTARTRSMDLTLKFATDSWVEVYDANGQRLFYDIGSAKSSHTVSGTPPLRVVLGNAPGVSLNVNGKPVKVPASAVQQDSAQFTINRAGRIVRSRDGG
jgi:cytoskeleton protein RodZ